MLILGQKLLFQLAGFSQLSVTWTYEWQREDVTSNNRGPRHQLLSQQLTRHVIPFSLSHDLASVKITLLPFYPSEFSEKGGGGREVFSGSDSFLTVCKKTSTHYRHVARVARCRTKSHSLRSKPVSVAGERRAMTSLSTVRALSSFNSLCTITYLPSPLPPFLYVHSETLVFTPLVL